MNGVADEVFFEFRRIGHSVKVVAFHNASMEEVSIICPASLGQQDMKRLALQKLVYKLGKKPA